MNIGGFRRCRPPNKVRAGSMKGSGDIITSAGGKRPVGGSAPAGSLMKLGLPSHLNSAASSSMSMAGPFPANTASTSCRGGCPVMS